ncbi:MAG: restriction endonuclease subunit R [Candidatus Brocadia sp. UTAMX2]|jgi:type III restriction enzyme|nr:MAG: restriction endonuclease subunit R [Candidatus Brocadia sp. UTAMX2]
MSLSLNTGTREIPLKFAREITGIVLSAWDRGEFLEKATPITQDLLRFWFSDAFTETRHVNFHDGQRQAILNTIYAHEILRPESVFDLYSMISNEILAEMDLSYLRKDKFSHPKYCMKMATGTGKTWVMNALLIWQYLNARHEEKPSGCYSTNFLLVAPGLIVYERLLDAYLGKQREDGIRDFEASDFKQYEKLFIPPAYRDEVYGFIQTCVVRKEEIGRKVTGSGLIAITNWHLLAGEEEEVDSNPSPLEDPSVAVKEIFPVTPGTSAGHDLNTLDNKYLSGGEIEYLAKLESIVVFNDEAHHIHETKRAGIVSEVEWQKSLNKISENKRKKFIQIDFSATPYDVTGSGQRRTKHYFPHIVVDFDLRNAIHGGLVKTITLDRRKEIATMELDFRAMRDGNKVIGLSEGQKLMLRAGLTKLKILEKEFTDLTQDKNGITDKHPKMLVICEDTAVSPYVTGFLTQAEGLGEEDVVQIDSDKKGSIPAKEWDTIKQRLFNVDKHEKPKVIVSVLMLREGFDVNNICVIVPLRSTQAPILLEQILGRGLRLMWREPEFQDAKEENRIRLLKRKEAPSNYLDILSIIEHPAFIEFYDDLIKEGLVGEITELPRDREGILGDIIKVGLKPDYKEYDLYWPVIIQEREEFLKDVMPSLDNLKNMPWYNLDQLKLMVCEKGETFYSEEMTVKTRFGDYKVTAELFTAKSYNEFLSKLVKIITSTVVKITQRRTKDYPAMQINQASLVQLIDDFVRHNLFNQEFNPLEDNNWRVLLLSQTGITEHIIKELSKVLYEMQNTVDVQDAIVIKQYFSQVEQLKMRENFSLDMVKTIYERLPYPSNKGELEKNFMLACDHDSAVKAFLKISEMYHDFAHLNYIRNDGILSSYYPDFIIKTPKHIYLVETKAQKDIKDENVLLKKQSALDWLKKINELKPDDRDNCDWSYVLLGENTFYSMQSKGASVGEILEYSKLTKQRVEGTLF